MKWGRWDTSTGKIYGRLYNTPMLQITQAWKGLKTKYKISGRFSKRGLVTTIVSLMRLSTLAETDSSK